MYPARLAQAAFTERRGSTATLRPTFRGWAGSEARGTQGQLFGSLQKLLQLASARALLVWDDGRLDRGHGHDCDDEQSHLVSCKRLV